MKIIEALKKIKDLQRKASDLRDKISKHCADVDFETPEYPEPAKQIQSWIQSHTDIVKEIGNLRHRIHKTNVLTEVEMELGGKSVTKSLYEWIQRRRDLAALDLSCWNALTDRGLKDGFGKKTNGDVVEIKVRRYFDSKERDKHKEIYASEPSIIDGQLEIKNAITDLME